MTNLTSVDHSTMREMNVALVLNTLRLHAPISRAGLAAQTGLNKASVSSMVKKLLASNFIREMGVDTSSTDIGRPAINLELNPNAGYIMSVEIGVGFISILVANFAIEIVARRYESTLDLRSQEAVIDRTIALLKENHEQISHRGKPIFGLAVGVPGLVDVLTGKLLFAPNLGWRDVPLRQVMEREFDLAIYIANEANMAALGENYFGTGQNSDLMLYVSSGIGLGGGIVLNGLMLEGATGFAGEFGHMTVDPNGLRCNCGNVGCWETVASQQAVFRLIKEAIASGQESALIEMTDGNLDNLTVPLVVQASRQGDRVACEALEETGRWLGIGLANLINAINPQCVVFGGPLSLARECLMPVIKDVVSQRALRWVQENAEIAIATHGADACVMGGIAMVHKDVLNNPLKWLKSYQERRS